MTSPHDQWQLPVHVDELWREAGGGTPGFNPHKYADLLGSGNWLAVDRCGDCGTLPPHLCWWSALGALVQGLPNSRRTPARACHETALF
jgi:hypothetical protein